MNQGDQEGHYVFVPPEPASSCAGCAGIIREGAGRIRSTNYLDAAFGRSWKHWHPECWEVRQQAQRPTG